MVLMSDEEWLGPDEPFAHCRFYQSPPHSLFLPPSPPLSSLSLSLFSLSFPVPFLSLTPSTLWAEHRPALGDPALADMRWLQTGRISAAAQIYWQRWLRG